MIRKKDKILKMDNTLFKQRRRVIECLYFVRNCLNRQLPYIKVRIVDFAKTTTMGCCYMDKDYICISDDIVNWNDDKLNSVVAHELLHAYYNIGHIETCPLMQSTLKNILNKEQIRAILSKYNQKVV